jgi:hypothetical protein
MEISVNIGGRNFGGQPWSQYTIKLTANYPYNDDEYKDGKGVTIVFLNKEWKRLVGAWGRETTYRFGEIALPLETAKALHRLLGDFLADSANFGFWEYDNAGVYKREVEIDESQRESNRRGR